MSTPQTIHKTVCIFRIHFVLNLHNFNEEFMKNPPSEIKISEVRNLKKIKIKINFQTAQDNNRKKNAQQIL